MSTARNPLVARERNLWVAALLVLCALAVGLAVTSWNPKTVWSSRIESFLPYVLVVLALLFAAYVWRKQNEIMELGALIRGSENHAATGYTPKQLDQLFSLIATSQRGFREIIDAFEDLVISAQLDGRILTVNRRVIDLLGKSFAEVVGQHLQDFFEVSLSPDAIERLMSSLESSRRCAEILQVRVKQTGATYYFSGIFHPIFRDGVIYSVTGLIRDVTRERGSEILFTELFGTLHEGVYIASADDRITEANAALAEMLGYPDKEALKGVQIASFYQMPEERVHELTGLNAAGILRTREVLLRRPGDGRRLQALHTSSVVRDGSGKLIRTQGTLLDITERRQIERRLHREEEFARSLIDSFPDVVSVVDREGRYSFVSQQVFSSLGYQPEELIGSKFSEMIDPEDRAATASQFSDLLSGRVHRVQVEFRKRHKDGTWRLIRAIAGPLHDQSGAIVGVIAPERDITDQQRLQRQLIQSERLVALGQMIAGVAHELNNPLTAILGVTELMHEQAKDDDSRRQLDLAHRQARRAARIVESLLAFSRPARPQSTLVYLGELVERTLQLHERSLATHQVRVDFAASAELPAVFGDPSQLTQVFLNLIVNAEQAIGEVRDHGTLTVRVNAEGAQVVVSIQDDGSGISRDALPRLFDPFFTTKRPGRGTGLGLSICMSIVREHNGEISAHPLPGGGSVFTVSLPACVQALAVLAPASTQLSRAACLEAASPLVGRRILVVDDEEGIRQFISGSLAHLGINADSVATGEDALGLLLGNSYDAVLSDLNLTSPGGGMNGFQLNERASLALAGKTAPVFVFMTGELLHGPLNQKLVETGVPFLQKPFRIAEMVSVLSESILQTTPR